MGGKGKIKRQVENPLSVYNSAECTDHWAKSRAERTYFRTVLFSPNSVRGQTQFRNPMTFYLSFHKSRYKNSPYFLRKNWNSSFKITFWWVECKWIRNTQIKFLSKYTWVSKLRGINFSKCFQFCLTSEVWCMVWDSWPQANFVHLCQGSTWESILFSLILSLDTLTRWLIR